MYRHVSLLALMCACLLLVSGVASAGATVSVNAADIDRPADALKIAAPRTYEVTAVENTTMSLSNPQTVCGRTVSHPVWFKFKADRAVSVGLTTDGTHLAYSGANQSYHENTVMGLYAHLDPESAPSHLTLSQVYCNDDAVATIEMSSQINFTAEPGMQYYVLVIPYLSTAAQAGSTYRLNARVTNLVEFGGFEDMADGIKPWKAGLLGSSDDQVICSGADCDYRFQHGLLGASTLKQTIKSFGGLKLKNGVALMLSFTMSFSGQPNASAKVKVVYTNGTSDSMTTAMTSAQNSGTLQVTSGMLNLSGAVSKIVVRFTDVSGGSGHLDIDNVWLMAIQAQPNREAALALPLPPVGG